ncbi:MAG: arsenate reductase ArsC [Thermoplasmata archaeon]|nr:arsenate reductase ArsC [Thermoplasmata archaeon]
MADRRVLFVCVGNAGRSLMAEALFNAEAPPGWRATSAGTRPAAAPNPRTGPLLRELGLELPNHSPQALTDEAMRSATIAVTMGCLDDASCPARLRDAHPQDWGLPDPAHLDEAGFRAVRDELRTRIRKLIVEIRRTDHV